MEERNKAAGVPEVPSQGITIELSYATVSAFEQAVEVLRKHPSFRQFGEGKNLKIRVTYQLNELEMLQEVKDATWELRHKRAWLHGEPVEWHTMAQLTYCFRELLQKPRREHCFFDGNFWSLFGCRYAIANLADRINNEWLSYGKLEPNGAWTFDKNRIADYVKRNLQLGYQHCPAFDAEYTDAVIALFPEQVDPTEDNRWQHLRDRQGNIIGVGPTGVDTAKRIVFELQDKVRQQRNNAGELQENGKRNLATEWFRPYKQPKKAKKGLLARLTG